MPDFNKCDTCDEPFEWIHSYPKDGIQHIDSEGTAILAAHRGEREKATAFATLQTMMETRALEEGLRRTVEWFREATRKVA